MDTPMQISAVRHENILKSILAKADDEDWLQRWTKYCTDWSNNVFQDRQWWTICHYYDPTLLPQSDNINKKENTERHTLPPPYSQPNPLSDILFYYQEQQSCLAQLHPLRRCGSIANETFFSKDPKILAFLGINEQIESGPQNDKNDIKGNFILDDMKNDENNNQKDKKDKKDQNGEKNCQKYLTFENYLNCIRILTTTYESIHDHSFPIHNIELLKPKSNNNFDHNSNYNDDNNNKEISINPMSSFRPINLSNGIDTGITPAQLFLEAVLDFFDLQNYQYLASPKSDLPQHRHLPRLSNGKRLNSSQYNHKIKKDEWFQLNRKLRPFFEFFFPFSIAQTLHLFQQHQNTPILKIPYHNTESEQRLAQYWSQKKVYDDNKEKAAQTKGTEDPARLSPPSLPSIIAIQLTSREQACRFFYHRRPFLCHYLISSTFLPFVPIHLLSYQLDTMINLYLATKISSKLENFRVQHVSDHCLEQRDLYFSPNSQYFHKDTTGNIDLPDRDENLDSYYLSKLLKSKPFVQVSLPERDLLAQALGYGSENVLLRLPKQSNRMFAPGMDYTPVTERYIQQVVSSGAAKRVLTQHGPNLVKIDGFNYSDVDPNQDIIDPSDAFHNKSILRTFQDIIGEAKDSRLDKLNNILFNICSSPLFYNLSAATLIYKTYSQYMHGELLSSPFIHHRSPGEMRYSALVQKIDSTEYGHSPWHHSTASGVSVQKIEAPFTSPAPEESTGYWEGFSQSDNDGKHQQNCQFSTILPFPFKSHTIGLTDTGTSNTWEIVYPSPSERKSQKLTPIPTNVDSMMKIIETNRQDNDQWLPIHHAFRWENPDQAVVYLYMKVLRQRSDLNGIVSNLGRNGSWYKIAFERFSSQYEQSVMELLRPPSKAKGSNRDNDANGNSDDDDDDDDRGFHRNAAISTVKIDQSLT